MDRQNAQSTYPLTYSGAPLALTGEVLAMRCQHQGK